MAPSPRELLNQITSAPTNGTFEPLLKHWEKRYGSAAASPLLTLASSSESSGIADPQRYVALMGAARLGGKSTAQKIAGTSKTPPG